MTNGELEKKWNSSDSVQYVELTLYIRRNDTKEEVNPMHCLLLE